MTTQYHCASLLLGVQHGLCVNSYGWNELEMLMIPSAFC